MSFPSHLLHILKGTIFVDWYPLILLLIFWDYHGDNISVVNKMDSSVALQQSGKLNVCATFFYF